MNFTSVEAWSIEFKQKVFIFRHLKKTAILHCDCLKGAVRLFTAWQIFQQNAVIFRFVCNKNKILPNSSKVQIS